ncbi:MAG TPA: SDR family NAD(P)-dependent oxidoreductase, partial [Arachidicoccus sp.]
MDLQLKDKVVIVTGGAKGIGAGIADILAQEGVSVVLIGRNE